MERRKNIISISELLVAITIVAILALVLFPAFGQARGLNAQQTCLTNLRQIGAANLMYAQDYDENMPPALQTATQIANPCPGAPPPVTIIETLYDALFPYLGNSQVLQCPTAPQAMDLCSDFQLAVLLGSGNIDELSPGPVNVVGSVRYVSYAFNRDLFGFGGFESDGENVTALVHSDGLPYPAALAAIVYPADTPTVYDGYIVGALPVTVATRRHGGSASVAYVDGHSAPFGMAEQPNGDYEVDEYTELPVNQFYIAIGPYRANPGAQPNSGFNGIVTDPVCETEALPQTECLTNTAAPVGTPTIISDVVAALGSQSAGISWNTSVPASGVVLYGTTTELGSSVSATGVTTSGSVTLTGLQPGTLYHYRVQATNASGNVVVSGDQIFVTSKPVNGVNPAGRSKF